MIKFKYPSFLITICSLLLFSITACGSYESPQEKIDRLESYISELEDENSSLRSRVDELEYAIDEAVSSISNAIYDLEYCDSYNFYYCYDLDEATSECENAKSTLEYVR